MSLHRYRPHLVGLAWLYALLVAAFLVLVTVVGESWWVTVTLLYLPRQPFVVPALLGLILMLRWPELRRPLALPIGVSLILSLVLLGPHLSWPRRAEGPTLRVVSMNVFYGRRGVDRIARFVDDAQPDIVLFQAMAHPVTVGFEHHFPAGWHLNISNEALIATRYPIKEVFEPDPSAGPRGYIRYTLETPLGLVDVFNIHPPSPRPGLSELKHGAVDEAQREADYNTEMRKLEVRDLAEAVARSPNKVIVAGDTNLPELSPLAREAFAGLTDGFAAVGNGFGYTFPTRLPWMRLDRVLARGLRFVRFSVGPRGLSDHLPVEAELEAAR